MKRNAQKARVFLMKRHVPEIDSRFANCIISRGRGTVKLGTLSAGASERWGDAYILVTQLLEETGNI
jgi:hypothetical protein